VTYHKGRARLVDVGVEVSGRLLTSERIVITTGARPHVPDIQGIAGLSPLDSTTALALTTLPDSMIVMGGGYVGAELTQIFARAGVNVTLVFRSRLLPDAEPEIGQALGRYLADEGIRIVGDLVYKSIRKAENGGVALTISRNGGSETLTADCVLVATGRTPNTEDLGLREAGVAQAPSGAIIVDDRMRTSRAGVYAAGDVTGKDQFVYMAAYGAKLAAKNALNGNSLRYDNAAMPAVVFTDPQVASVGLTEAEARAAGHDVRTSVLTLDNVPRALAARDTRGLIKLVADGATRRLLGAHILAPEGADSIQTATLAIRCGLTIDDVADTIFPYLTTVEGLKLAAQTFDKDVAKLSCCAG
jgi:mercuric reductase